MTDHSDKDPRDHLIDFFVHAPVGLLYEFSELYPEAVKRGKSQVGLGAAVAKAAAESKRSEYGEASSEFLAEAASFLRIVAARIEKVREEMEPKAEKSMPIDGYDSLTAKEVKIHLEKLEKSDVQSVLDYELANKNRKSVVATARKLLK